MKLSKDLLNIIVCPVSGGKLIYDQEKSVLISEQAGLAYPVIDGIPMLLASEAIKLDIREQAKESSPVKKRA